MKQFKEDLLNQIPDKFKKNWEELQAMKNKRKAFLPTVGKPSEIIMLGDAPDLTISDIAAGKAEQKE